MDSNVSLIFKCTRTNEEYSDPERRTIAQKVLDALPLELRIFPENAETEAKLAVWSYPSAPDILYLYTEFGRISDYNLNTSGIERIYGLSDSLRIPLRVEDKETEVTLYFRKR